MTTTIKVTDSAGNVTTKTIELNVNVPTPTGSYPLIFGAATTNNQTEFDARNSAWGPIRMSREYDSGTGARPVNQYAWYAFVKKNFKYLTFSFDEDYAGIANGNFDAQIKAMLNSFPQYLPGVQGVLCLGNEPNAKSEINPTTYRAALEYCMDRFGPTPIPGFLWGVAFSNYNVWGGGRTVGENWLPRRPEMPFFVETHCYGRTDYTPPESMIGRTFIPAVRKRPKWHWGIGEISAQESDKKGPWLAGFADYVANNGGSFFLPFDTGVGGSAPIGTSERTKTYVKGIAEKYKNNNWRTT